MIQGTRGRRGNADVLVVHCAGSAAYVLCQMRRGSPKKVLNQRRNM